MADTSFDSSAPDYPDLKGSNNSSAANMKNSVANCKVRASRKPARRGHCQSDTCMDEPERRCLDIETQDTAVARLGVCHFPVIHCPALLLSCFLLAENHPHTSLQTFKLTPNKQYLH
jgi:hypothetical protein